MSIFRSLRRFYLFSVLILFVTPTFSIASTTIEIYQNNTVKKIRPALDEFVYKALKEYPYLYVSQNESDYNSIFEKDPEAFVLLAKKEGKLIGTLQANPLSSPYLKSVEYTPATALKEIKKNGFDPGKILYVSTFLLSKDERANSDVIKKLFDKAVNIAKSMGKSQISYMEIIEDKNHPLRPNPYSPLEPWKELDRNFRTMHVETTMSWPTLQSNGKVKNENHKMAFFITDINKGR